MSARSISVFLSTVTAEFRAYRDQLVHDLTRHNVEVKVQEDFKDLGGDTLAKLDTYIAHCDAVVHLVGDMTGAAVSDLEQQALLRNHPDLPEKLPPLADALAGGERLSYTQWEAWLALYHGKLLLTAKADPLALRGPNPSATDASQAAQHAHLGRLEALRRYPGCTFKDPADLARHIAYTAILDLLAEQRGRAIAAQLGADRDSVTITTAGATLHLQKLHARRAPPLHLIDLLRTDLRATTLVGRDPDLADLAAWRHGPARVAVRCLTGPAGAGKTRLAIEACERAEAEGWAAAFAPSAELARFHTTQNLVSWEHDQDALIVVDYAATSLTVLKPWLTQLATDRVPEGKRLRLLLLERHASRDEGWFADLCARTTLVGASPADIIDPASPQPVPPLRTTEQRRALLAETMRLAAPLLTPPRAPLAPPAPGADPGFDAKLADDRLDNEPLYLAMAGIHAAQHGAPAALSLTGLKLAEDIAGIETARIERIAAAHGQADGGALLKHLAAVITLQSGCLFDALPALIDEERAALNLPAPSSTAAHLCEALRETEGKLDAIRPDLIGETFLVPVLRGDKFRAAAARTAILRRAYHRAPAETVDSLIRTAQDLAAGRADHPATAWLGTLAEHSQDLDELQRIVSFLPRNTLALRELAADLQQRIVFTLQQQLAADPDESDPALAGALNDLGVRLSDLGRREAALAAAEGAVALRRTLAAARPETFTPVLAMSLNNLATFLSDLGRREAALAAAQEAVALLRPLAAARPEALMPDMAMALNNLANRLSEFGRREAALAAAEEAVALRRTLAAGRPDAFTPNLAMSLNNLATFLSDLGRREAALAAAEEAVALYRTLAAARPDAFTPNLAMSLNTLASSLSDLGSREAALAAAEEAAALYRTLASARPDAFTPNLAGSLNNLANRLSALGRRESALTAAEEAVALYRTLAAGRPNAFTPNLAISLSVLADRQEEAGRLAEAIDADEDCLRRLSAFATQHPQAFVPRALTYAQDYRRRCQAAGRKPDEALLDLITAAHESLQPPAPDSPPTVPSPPPDPEKPRW